MTSFTYMTTVLTMSQDPIAPRDFEESQIEVIGYDSSGKTYAYDCSSPIYRTESLVFPTIDFLELDQLMRFINSTLDGSYKLFTWVDRISTTRIARFKSMSYIKVSNNFYKVTLTLEVLS